MKTDVLEPTRLRVGATVRTKIPVKTKLLVCRRTTINKNKGELTVMQSITKPAHMIEAQSMDN